MIVFLPSSSGGSATIGLSGNGTLDVSQSGQTLAIAGMNLSGGIIACTLGTQTTDVVVTGNVNIWTPVTFNFVAGTGFEEGTAYTILTAPIFHITPPRSSRALPSITRHPRSASSATASR